MRRINGELNRLNRGGPNKRNITVAKTTMVNVGYGNLSHGDNTKVFPTGLKIAMRSEQAEFTMEIVDEESVREFICRLFTKVPKTTVGKALTEVERKRLTEVLNICKELMSEEKSNA